MLSIPFLKAILDRIFISLLLATAVACGNEAAYRTTATVHIEKNEAGYALKRHGTPYIIRGVAGHTNLQLLRQIGGNTIRTYDTTGLRHTLDEAHQYEIAVVAGIFLPKSNQHWFYKNDSLVEAFDTSLRTFVSSHKDHPALLMWCLGNEPNYYDLLNFSFAKAYNRFLETLRNADPDHPVTMALANFSDREIVNLRLKIPDLGLLMINTFGRLPKLESDLAAYRVLWRGPYMIGEYGINGPWETDNTAWQAPIEPAAHAKAARLQEMHRILPHHDGRFLGAFAFYWGQRQEATHTWFNFFSDKNERSQMVYALSSLWKDSLSGNRPPQVGNLQINRSTEYNSFLFECNTLQVAEVEWNDPDGDSLQVEWTLRPDDWFFEKATAPDPVAGSFLTPESEGRHVKFRTPAKPGPFRLFVKVTDGNGHFATANMPFYVVR